MCIFLIYFTFFFCINYKGRALINLKVTFIQDSKVLFSCLVNWLNTAYK